MMWMVHIKVIGTYRCKASALVTDYNGYSESLTGYSSSISI